MQTNPKAEVAALPSATGASDPATRSVPKTTEHNADAWTRTFSAALCAQPRGGSHPSGQHLNGEAKRAPSPRCRGQDEGRPRYDVDEPRKHEAEGKDPGAKPYRVVPCAGNVQNRRIGRNRTQISGSAGAGWGGVGGSVQWVWGVLWGDDNVLGLEVTAAQQ